MIHFILTVRDKNGKVIQIHERVGEEATLACLAELIQNPTWSITVRQS